MRQCSGQGVFERGGEWTGRAGGHSVPTWSSSLRLVGVAGRCVTVHSSEGIRGTHKTHHNGVKVGVWTCDIKRERGRQGQ